MALKIERRFLVDFGKFTEFLAAVPKYTASKIEQGYLSEDPVVRLRISENTEIDNSAPLSPVSTNNTIDCTLTIKANKSFGVNFEYNIPVSVEDALVMFHTRIIKYSLSKTRINLPYEGYTWSVDIFTDTGNRGLTIAEVELKHHIAEPIKLPPFVTEEVTGKEIYSNLGLSKTPYNKWIQGKGKPGRITMIAPY